MHSLDVTRHHFSCAKARKLHGQQARHSRKCWMHLPLLVLVPPSDEELRAHFPKIERFVVLMYDRTSTCESVDAARKELFTQKGRSIEYFPPTSAALFQHTKRTVFQAAYVWGQTLQPYPELPDPYEWGWTRKSSGISAVIRQRVYLESRSIFS